MWCSYHKTTTHSDADCRTRLANRPNGNGNAHFAQFRRPSVSGVYSSWDLSGRDDSDEKPCISFLAREVQPATKPSKARVEEKGARPFGPVSTAATEGWRTRPWPFIPRAEPQPVTEPAKSRVEEEKGAWSFGPVSTAATEGWRTRPWPFTPRAEQAISFGGPVAEETFGMANDEESVEKALMASSSVVVASEDSANNNLVTLVAPAEYFFGEIREHLSGGASTPCGMRASPEKARFLQAPVPATARTGAAIRNNRIHRLNVVTRRAAVELTGAITRHRGVRPNNNNHAALAECFQSSTLHKLQQLGISTNTDTPDDNDINSNNHAALAERFQSSTLHKVRQVDRYTNTDTPDTAQQLDAEAVPAEVAYTRSNTQPSCLGGRELDHVLQGGHVRFTPSYIVTLANAPIIFKVGPQGLTA